MHGHVSVYKTIFGFLNLFPSWTSFLCRQLQRGPGNSEVNPKSIKENLRRGLEALKTGLSILKVRSNGFK